MLGKNLKYSRNPGLLRFYSPYSHNVHLTSPAKVSILSQVSSLVVQSCSIRQTTRQWPPLIGYRRPPRIIHQTLLKVPRCAMQDFIEDAPPFNIFNVLTEHAGVDKIGHDPGKLWKGLSGVGETC